MTAALPDPRPTAGEATEGHPGAELAEMADSAGIHRVHILAWRDLDDPEAGGSEVHAAAIAEVWARAGIDVTLRTSSAAGHPTFAQRDGYRVVRKAGRYAVFPRTALSGLVGRTGPRDAMVEIWNGMPFFSPVWARQPSVVFLHHVHAEMWRMALKPAALARLGELVEYRIAPPFYRRARIVTLSESSRREIVELLGLPGENVSVVPPGVANGFSPGGRRAADPLVIAVGRLVPVKRFEMLIETLVSLRQLHPTLEAVIVGEGYERPALEAHISRHGAERWLSLRGRVSDDELIGLYRRAWLLTSCSLREGWGMTITEAAACGTPAVVSDIAGHRDAVLHGESGLLAGASTPQDPTGLLAPIDRVLGSVELRQRLAAGALAQASLFTWEACARGTLQALAEEAARRAVRPGPR